MKTIDSDAPICPSCEGPHYPATVGSTLRWCGGNLADPVGSLIDSGAGLPTSPLARARMLSELYRDAREIAEAEDSGGPMPEQAWRRHYDRFEKLARARFYGQTIGIGAEILPLAMDLSLAWGVGPDAESAREMLTARTEDTGQVGNIVESASPAGHVLAWTILRSLPTETEPADPEPPAPARDIAPTRSDVHAARRIVRQRMRGIPAEAGDSIAMLTLVLGAPDAVNGDGLRLAGLRLLAHGAESLADARADLGRALDRRNYEPASSGHVIETGDGWIVWQLARPR